ncbi:hypothetical protein FB451DRAFT_1193845 [Mycena latifolia]|nr:hypothetical protein FB451DRAFT_1193845 [Mycena latifolia]
MSLSLFQTRGPWLHSYPSPWLNAHTITTLLSNSLPHTIDYVTFIQKHLDTSYSEWMDKNYINRGLLRQYLLLEEITSNANDALCKYLERDVAPVLVFDVLLHTLDPDHPTPPFSWAPDRPHTSAELCRRLSQKSACNVTTPKSQLRRKATRQLNPCPNYPPDPRESTSASCAPSPRAPRQAPDALKPYTTFNNWRTPSVFIFRDAQRQGITLTAEEVEANLENHKGKVMTAPLWVTMVHSILLILCDNSGYTSRHYAVPAALFQLDATQALNQFFASNEFKAMIDTDGTINDEDTLAYASDPPPTESPARARAASPPPPAQPAADSNPPPPTQPTADLNPPPPEDSTPLPPDLPAEPVDGADADCPPKKGKQTAATPLCVMLHSVTKAAAQLDKPTPVDKDVPPKSKRRRARAPKKAPQSEVLPTMADVGETMQWPLADNGLVQLYGSDSSLVVRPTEAQCVQTALADGKKLDMDAKRPLSARKVSFKVYCPAINPKADPILRKYIWPMFEAATFNEQTLNEMLTTQVLDDKGIPLHCWENTRNLDPRTCAGLRQLFVLIVMRADWDALGDKRQHELHHHRCILILESGGPPEHPFTHQMLERFHDVDGLCEIQDPGLRTKTNEDITHIGTLADLLDHKSRDGRPLLNSLQNPMPYRSHCCRAGHCPLPFMSWEDLWWIIIATLNAKSRAHQDVLATVIALLCGWKVWAIAVQGDTDGTEMRGDFSSRHGFRDWSSQNSNKDIYRREFILLGPNMTFYMQARTIHYIISLEDCIGWGHHGHCLATLSRRLWCALHNIISDSATTNADHACKLVANQRSLHILDLEQKTHVFDLVNLISIIILFTALDSSCYQLIENGMLPMHAEHFDELVYAWSCLSKLFDHINGEMDFASDKFESFEQLSAVVHMACSLVRYQWDWSREVKHHRTFTIEAFQLQLRHHPLHHRPLEPAGSQLSSWESSATPAGANKRRKQPQTLRSPSPRPKHARAAP